MKTKKHPKANLDNYTKLFVQLGLVLSLIVVYSLIQNKTLTKNTIVLNEKIRVHTEEPIQMVDIKIEKQIPKTTFKKQVLPEIIIKAENNSNIDEVFFDNIDTSDPVDINSFVDEKNEDEPMGIDVVDYVFLEEAPLFPGCSGTNEERKACFSNKISKYINRKFNTELAFELGLKPGIQKIYTQFKIDKNGNITDVQARSPHKELQLEAIRVINLLPKMEPGKQQGNPVKVRYSIPIVFKVE
ncbi:energy transducer TonB [Lutibacter sp. B1]|uniref:energy transducer TonB n=1 Tax=Lutibacter sp. B1 TaxID=2725996 RepID=UPI001457957A|nr:energy transducer TonB [Lutibacter sp. B1]NLP57854.1 energy transducer TonB [Lutibacter sp. B1]